MFWLMLKWSWVMFLLFCKVGFDCMFFNVYCFNLGWGGSKFGFLDGRYFLLSFSYFLCNLEVLLFWYVGCLDSGGSCCWCYIMYIWLLWGIGMYLCWYIVDF